jgi:hypothetical protein
LSFALGGTRSLFGTTAALNTTNVPPGSPVSMTVLSFVQISPGIDLGGIGAPGCSQYVGNGPDVLIPAPLGGFTVNLPIPNVPAFAGQALFVQSAAMATGLNPLGVITSNGLALLVGNF